MLKMKIDVDGKEKLRPIPMLLMRIIREVGVLGWRIMLKFIPYKTGFLRTTTNIHRISRFKLYVGPLAIYARAQDLGMPGAPGRFVPAIGKRLTGTKTGYPQGWWPGFKGKFFTLKTYKILMYKAPVLVRRIVKDYFEGG